MAAASDGTRVSLLDEQSVDPYGGAQLPVSLAPVLGVGVLVMLRGYSSAMLVSTLTDADVALLGDGWRPPDTVLVGSVVNLTAVVATDLVGNGTLSYTWTTQDGTPLPGAEDLPTYQYITQSTDVTTDGVVVLCTVTHALGTARSAITLTVDTLGPEVAHVSPTPSPSAATSTSTVARSRSAMSLSQRQLLGAVLGGGLGTVVLVAFVVRVARARKRRRVDLDKSSARSHSQLGSGDRGTLSVIVTPTSDSGLMGQPHGVTFSEYSNLSSLGSSAQHPVRRSMGRL